MARQLKLRFARPEDSRQIAEWLHSSEYNEFNAETLKSPSLSVLCSYDETGPQNYILINKVLMLDSTAPRPGIDVGTAAQSMRDFTKSALLLASGQGISEIYALDMGGGLGEMAQNHHFKLLGKEVNGKFEAYKIYRITV